MDKKNIYEIKVGFKTDTRKVLFKESVEYLGSKSYKDDIEIYSNKINISATRSSNIKLSNIFYNHNSSLYNQIIKTLAFYYSSTRKFVEIQSLVITRKRSSKILNEKRLKKSEINQIISDNFSLSYNLGKDNLSVLFSETEKGKTTLNALTYLLKANSCINEGEKFEKLWKSFNQLYRLIGQGNTEFDCLVGIKKFINTNYTRLNYSTKSVNKLDSKELRLSLRWRAMIINNYDTEKQTKNFRDSILRYSDHRVMNVFKETLGNREQFLKNKGYYAQVVTHLDNHINAKTTVDNELISVLILKYMYFVRNKTFHGEKIDSTFRLAINKEIKEFKWLNEKLEPFIIDLINCNDLY
jgi:hypothetical protein